MFAVPSATRANFPSREAFSLVSAPLPKTPTASAPNCARGRCKLKTTRASPSSQVARSHGRRAGVGPDRQSAKFVGDGGPADNCVAQGAAPLQVGLLREVLDRLLPEERCRAPSLTANFVRAASKGDQTVAIAPARRATSPLQAAWHPHC